MLLTTSLNGTLCGEDDGKITSFFFGDTIVRRGGVILVGCMKAYSNGRSSSCRVDGPGSC
jgi:hypothetical protein